MNYSMACDETSWSETGFVLDMNSLAGYFERWHDQRCARGKRYRLAQICLLATLAKLSGEDPPTGIAQWAQAAAVGFRPDPGPAQAPAVA